MIYEIQTAFSGKWNLSSDQLPRDHSKRYLCCDSLGGEVYAGRLQVSPNAPAAWVDCFKIEYRKCLYWMMMPKAPRKPKLFVNSMQISEAPAKGHQSRFNCGTCGRKIGERKFAVAWIETGECECEGEVKCLMCLDCIESYQKAMALTETAEAT
jgi:hypothetical protein